MQEYLPFLKKRLENKTLEKNGYNYEFLKIRWDESLFEFTVNTLLPEKDGGFVLEKIYSDIGEIVDDFFSYLGIKSTISVQVYVDGQDVKSSYLPYEKVQEVFELANKNYNISVIKTKTAEYKFLVEYLPLSDYKNTVQFDDGVVFITLINIKKVLVNGVETEPDLSSEMKESIFVSHLYDKFEQSLFENAMYDVLEPQLRFGSSDDLYYNAYIRISYYKGKKIDDSGFSSNSTEFSTLFQSSDD